MPTGDRETGQGQIVRINGTDIFYKTYGQGEPLLLIHGGTVSGNSWQPYIAAFAEHFRLIVPDTPGHGRSGTPDAELSYPGLADDMAALIDALALRETAGRRLQRRRTDRARDRHAPSRAAPRPGGRRRLLPLQPVLPAWLGSVFGEAAAGGRRSRELRAQPPRLGGVATPRSTAPTHGRRFSPASGRCGRRRSTTAATSWPGSPRRRWSSSATATRSSRSRKRRSSTAGCPRGNWPSSPDADHGAFFDAKVHVFQPLMLDFLRRQAAGSAAG